MDPTRKDNGVPDAAALRRPLGQFVIQWDPNSGQLGFNSQGLNPVEEIGLLQWMINMRMGANLNILPNNQVKIAQPGEIPPGPQIVKN